MFQRKSAEFHGNIIQVMLRVQTFRINTRQEVCFNGVLKTSQARIQVFTALTTRIVVLGCVTPCSLVEWLSMFRK